ncbi:MAG TPA: MFS transporter [Methanomassiliicoccales archaeon]|nr:MFS transporter [Methanomassiliicoccales archaeon]
MVPSPEASGRMHLEHSKRSKQSVQIAAALGSTFAPFMVGALIVAAPTIGKEFTADVTLLSWLTAAFFLAAAACLIPFGRAADIRGAKRIFILGLGTSALSTAIGLAAPDIYVLIAARALMGIGAGMIFGTTVALVSLVFPASERPRAIGINVTAMFIGYASGLLVGGYLSAYFSWRLIFLIALVLCLASMLLTWLRVRGECELARVHDYDFTGMGSYALGIVLIFFGLARISSLIGALSLVGGAAVLILFIMHERRYPVPLIHREITRSRGFRSAIATNIAFQAGSFAFPFLISLHLQYVSKIDPLLSGLILLLPQSLMILLGPASYRLADRFGRRKLVGAACIMDAVAVAMVMNISAETPMLLIVTALGVFGVATGLFMPAVLAWSLGEVSRENFGVASAYTETTRLAGMTLSNAVVIIVFGVVLGAQQVNPAVIPQFLNGAQLSLAVLVALSLAGAVISLGIATRFASRHKKNS